VLFETELAEAPFATCGTAFLVGFGRSVYLITARHVVRDFPAERLHIRAADDSVDTIPFTRWFVLPPNPDDDVSDLYLMRIDLANMPAADRKSATLLNLTTPQRDWFASRGSAQFFLFGYPVTASDVNFDLGTVTTSQYFLSAHYVGPSIGQECHELCFANPLALTDLNGMSGSPVFCQISSLGVSGLPIFAGMALRGSVLSKRVHLLGSSRIIAALEAAEKFHTA
jgi:hypothetical protein